jgi:hypothetical protein
VCRIVVVPGVESQLEDSTHGTTKIRHTGHVTARYMINHPSDLYLK